MINLNRAFCTSKVCIGHPVGFTGNYINGFSEISLFNGNNKFFGVSLFNVVDDGLDIFCLDQVCIGGLINVANSGIIRIPKDIIVNNKESTGLFIKPTKNGKWKIKKNRSKKLLET